MRSTWRTAALAFALVACGEAPERGHLAVIVLDTVRADHLSSYGHERPTTPFLDRFAAEGARFERAYSTSSWTLPSHASMFSGLGPDEHGATQMTRALPPTADLLASELAEAGYATAGFSNNPWVSKRFGLAWGFEHFVDLFEEERAATGLEDHATLAAVEAWANERASDTPFFAFVNLMEAHGPLQPPWEFCEPFFDDRADYEDALARMDSFGALGWVRQHYLEREAPTADDIAAARRLYEGELRFADAVAERLVGMFEREAGEEPLTVLVLSDHGENFGEHGHLGHVFSVYDSTLRVAMLARGPGFEAGRVESGLVQVSDLYETVLRVAGLPVPSGREGLDLRGAVPEDRGLRASYSYPRQTLESLPESVREDPLLDPHRRGLRVALRGRYKLIVGTDGSEELYDLVEDRGETTPLVTAPDGLLEELRTLAGSFSAAPETGGGDEPELDEATRRALRDLGYAGDE